MTSHLWAIAAVFGALGILQLCLRRLSGVRAGSRRSLRVVESCALGARKHVHVVEVDGERLLLGASESGVALLKLLPGENPGDEPSPAKREEPRAPVRGRVGGWRALRRSSAALAFALLAFASVGALPAAGQDAESSGVVLSLSGMGDREDVAPALEVLALLTVVSIAPSFLLMGTCFTRIVIVLAFVRQAVGVQHLPPNQVLVGLALFLTLFVMAPLGERIHGEAYEPYVSREIPLDEAARRGLVPMRDFFLKHTREADLALFVELSEAEPAMALEDIPTTTLLPAFLISELRTAFEIGFVIFMPFLVIDLVVSSMLISMGMIVLPPAVVALPFKIMLFVLVDGWNLILGSLVQGLR